MRPGRSFCSGSIQLVTNYCENEYCDTIPCRQRASAFRIFGAFFTICAQAENTNTVLVKGPLGQVKLAFLADFAFSHSCETLA